MLSYAVPDGYERLEKPLALARAQYRPIKGLHVLMRFQRLRRSRVDGESVQLQWSEWSLGEIVKQRSAPGLVDIQWPDVGRRTSELNLAEYGGGPEDGPKACWVFCKKYKADRSGIVILCIVIPVQNTTFIL